LYETAAKGASGPGKRHALDGAGLHPVVGALKAAERDLREERIDRAWVDLDIAAQGLARQASLPGGANPALDRAYGAVERARDLLGRAQGSQAMASIASALLALLG
jgi:hypothetical protein